VRDLNGELSENEPGGYADWNASINSLTGWGANNSSSALQTMAALVEQATDGDEGESHKSSTVAKNNKEADTETVLIARAEKVKKQANAKFNKGDFTAARRTLYTLGIQSMAKLERRLGPKEAEMLSNMHSNRSVNFFEKRISFRACFFLLLLKKRVYLIKTYCEVAIQYNPCYEKIVDSKIESFNGLGIRRSSTRTSTSSGGGSVSDNNKNNKE
jgi:hypothetical protein